LTCVIGILKSPNFYAILFLDPKLQNKGAVNFFPLWNLLNKTCMKNLWFIAWVEILTYVVLFLLPEFLKLLNKSTMKFVLRWNFWNKNFIPPLWVRINIEAHLGTCIDRMLGASNIVEIKKKNRLLALSSDPFAFWVRKPGKRFEPVVFAHSQNIRYHCFGHCVLWELPKNVFQNASFLRIHTLFS
jgi:hypothetical protein